MKQEREISRGFGGGMGQAQNIKVRKGLNGKLTLIKKFSSRYEQAPPMRVSEGHRVPSKGSEA